MWTTFELSSLAAKVSVEPWLKAVTLIKNKVLFHKIVSMTGSHNNEIKGEDKTNIYWVIK